MMTMGRWLEVAGIVSVLALTACGGGGDGGAAFAPTPPQVISTLPADGDAGVPADSNVAITWDQEVDCATVNTGTVKATSAGWALVSCSESRAIFFASGQSPLETNQVSVTANVRSAAGRAMAEDHTFSYTISASPPVWGGTILEGGAGIDSAHDGVTDAAGNIYLVGTTSSALFATSNQGADVFVAKYDANGTRLWGTQFGETGADEGLGIAVVGNSVYVVGTLSPGTSLEIKRLIFGDSEGGNQAFLAKLEDNPTEGVIKWIRHFGTTQDDSARDVVVDSAGNIYVAGSTFGTLAGEGFTQDEDAILARFRDEEGSDGNLGRRLWVSQFGLDSSDEDATAVAVGHDGLIYTAGMTGTVDNNGDAYAASNSSIDGSQQNLWRLGQANGTDFANALAIDVGNKLYLAGRTETDIDGDGTQRQGASDAFLAKIDPDIDPDPDPEVDPSTTDAVQWIEVIASSGEDEAFGVAVDDFGNLYMTGEANGNLVGEANGWLGLGDVFTGRFTLDGDRNWLDFLGTQDDETGFEVFLGDRGIVFVIGATEGDLDVPLGTNSGNSDTFLVRYTSAGVLE